MREEAILFGKASSLVGIITYPIETKSDKIFPAIVLLNAGRVHHVGPNRLHVIMARRLADNGFPVFRFDFSGIGDSTVREDNLPFKNSALLETQEAMDYMSRATGNKRFILMGICSGASVSFKTACCDKRVIGAVLINAAGHLHNCTDDALNSYIWNRTSERHYWRVLSFRSLFSAKKWLKAIAGKVEYRNRIKLMMGFKLRRLFEHKRKVSSGENNIATDLRLLTERDVSLLHVYSEEDKGLDYLKLMLGDEMKVWSSNIKSRVEIIPGADHTFTMLWSKEYLINVVHNWVKRVMQD